MRFLSNLVLCLLGVISMNAQELLATVEIDFSSIQTPRTQIYTTLDQSLTQFLNTTKWTDKSYKPEERIECTFFLTILEVNGNNFSGTLQVQARRPIFNSTYYSPILNFTDRNLSFQYNQFEQLIFNERQFSRKNLVDTMAFYVYFILGFDADTFARNGGTNYYKQAQQVATNSTAQGFDGWDEIEGPRTRTALINTLLNARSNTLRTALYQYHRLGLDQMYKQNQVRAKQTIGKALISLDFYVQSNNFTQNYPLDLFIQTKKTEISEIFSGGQRANSLNIGELKEVLRTISPTNNQYWDKIE